MRGLRIVSVLLCLWAAFAPPRALADPETDRFNAAIAAAYAHYREAMHYLESDNAELGRFALSAFAAAWRQIYARYRDAPPPAFARYDRFGLTLSAMTERLEEGMAMAQRDPAGAALYLELLRLDFATLRRESPEAEYFACFETMSDRTESLWIFRRNTHQLADPKHQPYFRNLIAEAADLYRRCQELAPATYRGSEEFRRLFAGALASLKKLAAADVAQTDAVVSILRELHSFYRLIWLKFG